MTTRRARELNRLAREIDTDLRAVRQALRRPIDIDIARGRLTGPQILALQALVPTDGLTLKELSARIGLAHSTVSVIIDRLEARRLVRREPHPSDGRATRILVARQVNDYVQRELPKLRVQPLTAALAAATPREREVVASGVRVLRRMLEKRPGR